MIVIDKTIVSDDLLDKEFVCALDKCKGACCVEGDSGAPLEWEETAILESIYEQVKPYMTEEGKAAVEKYGTWLIDSEGDLVTPLINGVRECAYTYFENGIAKCAIERACRDGKIDFQKPISCHLYPVRITKHENYDAVNYNRWNICSPACANGRELGISVHEFVKTALIRKYGQEWYNQLEGAAAFMESGKTT
ncbi:MAG: DUF3109 family protein [Chitinophagales bacterium]|nr:DUF3109 family protein [Bacteroidota bacterium]MBX7140829.1 DUF3109 family protein [Chitinophagales bacterium]